ncbi:MAG: hypothetical protein LBC19_06055 [Tannerella sp.]|jgi:hypothetical protein|nr:hypothetical protein [Tannerella sp.]
MAKKILIFCLLAIASSGLINAQNWSREDSLWLRTVIGGNGDVKINEDTKKAIEEGRLIVPPWMKNSENKVDNVEILKDFDDAGRFDSVRVQSIDPYSMPPAVFALYVLYMHKVDSINASMTCLLSAEEQESLASFLPPEARKGFYVSSVTGGFGGMDFNDLLSMTFSPSYRRKKYNAKYAVAYKNYYDAGIMPPKGLTEQERKRIRQDLRNFKVSKDVTIGMKRHGIDD